MKKTYAEKYGRAADFIKQHYPNHPLPWEKENITMRKLYAVYDLVAGEVIGPIFQHAADAAAIRDFSDVAADRNTTIGKHPADYQLISLGTLEGLQIKPAHELIVSGSQWLALQEKNTIAARGPVAAIDSPANGRG